MPRHLIAPLVALALVAAFPLSGATFYVELTTKIMIMAIFALSLDLLVGWTGLVSFGHAAFFGVGAYALALLSPKAAAAGLWSSLGIAIVAAALCALVVGIFVLRTRGIYFIMVTLAFAQMAYYVFHDTPLGGGSDGKYIYFRPDASIAGWQPFDLDSGHTFYYAVLVCLVASFGGLAMMLRSRFGRALAGIRVNEQRMRAAGFPTYVYKLAAFVIAAAFAGLAGLLHALKDGYVNPEILSWHQSGAVLLMVILGGIGSLRGAILGAFAFTMLQELFQWQAIFGSFAKHWQLMLGLTIIAFVAALPRGLVGLADRLRRRHG